MSTLSVRKGAADPQGFAPAAGPHFSFPIRESLDHSITTICWVQLFMEVWYYITYSYHNSEKVVWDYQTFCFGKPLVRILVIEHLGMSTLLKHRVLFCTTSRWWQTHFVMKTFVIHALKGSKRSKMLSSRVGSLGCTERFQNTCFIMRSQPDFGRF